MGGVLAMRTALAHPKSVSHLVLTGGLGWHRSHAFPGAGLARGLSSRQSARAGAAIYLTRQHVSSRNGSASGYLTPAPIPILCNGQHSGIVPCRPTQTLKETT